MKECPMLDKSIDEKDIENILNDSDDEFDEIDNSSQILFDIMNKPKHPIDLTISDQEENSEENPFPYDHPLIEESDSYIDKLLKQLNMPPDWGKDDDDVFYTQFQLNDIMKYPVFDDN